MVGGAQEVGVFVGLEFRMARKEGGGSVSSVDMWVGCHQSPWRC